MLFPISRRAAALCVLVAALAAPTLAHNLDKKSFVQLKAQTRNFAHASSARVAMNKPMPNFAAPTLDGKGLSKSSFKGKMGLFVLADTQCPCVQANDSRILNLSKKYKSKGLRVAYVFSMPKEKPLAIARFMQEHQIPFPAIVDRDQRMLKMLDGQCSSEVYLTDKNGILRYHGRVDDSTFDPKAVKSRDLENAIVAVMKGKRVAKAEVPAMGCAIPRL
jgi:peroxiredoxin